MSTNSKLQTAVRLALGVSAGALAVSVAPSAFAQEGGQDQVIEEIITTGSRIKRADLDSASPVTVISREDIISTGLTDVGNLLQRMPSMSGSPIGTTTNNGNTDTGSVQIDLRGMGPDRTLTLVNGKRIVNGDFQSIPATMIERVEVLKDGASAVYGADAVAGVVNIITRRDFEGIEVSLQTADFFDMDSGAQNTIGVIAGTTFDGGNFVFGAEYVDQEEAFQSDTPWDFFQDSYYIYPGGCENQVAAPYDGTPSGGCYPIGSSRIPQSRLGFIDPNPDPDVNDSQGLFLVGTPAGTPYEVGTMIPHDGRTYNYAPVNYIQTPYKRSNVFAEGRFDLTETVQFNMGLRATFRESAQELAPMPFNSPTDPAHDGVFDSGLGPVAYSGISEDNYYLRRAVDAWNADPANAATPLTYQPISDARRRMIETKRRFTQDVTQYQVVAGLEGSFNEMDWEVYGNSGYRSIISGHFGQFNGTRLFNAMGPSADLDNDGQPECYTDINNAATLIANCVPLNFFGGGEVTAAGQLEVGTLTDDMIGYVSVDPLQSRLYTQNTAGASISGGVFDLQGGPLGWAAGYQYWGQTLVIKKDSAQQINAVTGNKGLGTEGSLYANAVFVEVLAPVWDNGSQALDIKAGLRQDEWNQFDGETTWQVGFELQAVESLKFRATAGTIFRVPTISDLFGGTSDSFPTYFDPCIPAAGNPLPPGCDRVGVQFDSQLLAKVGGNELLIPETGETFTAGVVWTPQFGDSDLSVTVDYWQVDLEDGISSLGVQFILDDCYLSNNQTSCDLVTRRADYSIAQVIDGSLNVADQGAQGIDSEIRYTFDSAIGQWEAALLWSHLLERTKTPFPGADEEDLSGRYTNKTGEDGGAYATDKFNYSIQWFRNDFSVGYLGEYISELDTLDAGLIGDYAYVVEDQLYHDLVANYSFASTGTTIAAGVTNLTDEEPPYIDLGFNAKTEPATYRMFGRGYYLRLTQSFE